MHRNSNSHKGQHGVVAVIGGSKSMHGAPIFSALSAEASGVDLIRVCVPECHAEAAKAASPNFFVHAFHGNDLAKTDVSGLEEILAESSVAVIGPGLAEFETAQQALQKLLNDAAIPLVLDAAALQPWTLDLVEEKPVVLTPHIRELGRMQGQVLENASPEKRQDLVCTIAKTRKVTMILKGPIDIIAGAEGTCMQVKGGNAGLTKGGTGDALAGLIAGLIAQTIDPVQACIMATTIIKRAAVVLYTEKGYAFTTMDVIGQIPHLLHTYS